MKWSAVITTYNSGSVIEQALTSIFNLPPDEAPEDVVVVDNHSCRETVNILEAWQNRIRLVRNSRNLGLSAANAIGAGLTSGDSLFFLNPDVELLPGSVTELMEFQESHPRAALLGPSMTDGNGEVQSTARTWPSPVVVAARRTVFGRTSAGKRIAGHHLNSFMVPNEPVKPHWLVGAALWLTPEGRRRVGLMSESYFLYFEDVEWCWRTWEKGMEVWFVPGSGIRHVCRRESAGGGITLKYHLRSMLRFYLTHPSVLIGNGPGGMQ